MQERRRVALVPVVVEPVVVPVPPRAVPIEVTDIGVAVGVAICMERRPCRPLYQYRLWHHNAVALHTKYLHFL